jgi:hypothetical protein
MYIAGGEWYMVYGDPGHGQELAQDLQRISNAIDSQTDDFGLQKAQEAWKDGAGKLKDQQKAATRQMAEFASDWFTILQKYKH